MTLSIIICTRNRAESLRPTLASIGRAAVPAGWSVELLVVDNASTDHTRAVVSDAKLKNMGLRYVVEPKAGLSHARNAGLKETSGEIILFTDDDVRVPAGWIEAMARKIIGGEADAIAGGVVFPPDVERAVNSGPLRGKQWFASTEKLDPSHPNEMVGANMAFHRRVLDQVSHFDVELGAGALGYGEETLFSWQLISSGYRLTGGLDVSVEHHFDVSRMTREGLKDIARKLGRSDAFMFHHWAQERARHGNGPWIPWEHQGSWLGRALRTRFKRQSAQLVTLWFILFSLSGSWARMFKPPGRTADGDVSRDLRREQDLAFYREYAVQRKRERKYPLPGR